MSDAAATPEAPPELPPGARPSKLMPIALVVNSLLIAGVLLMLVLKPAGSSAEPVAKHAEKTDKDHADKSEASESHSEHSEGGDGEHSSNEPASSGGPTVHLADFVVHLRNPDTERYARISFDIEVGSDRDKAELSSRMPAIRDGIISYLSDRTLEELRGSEGLATTKRALYSRLVEISPGTRVKAVYITDFVIQ